MDDQSNHNAAGAKQPAEHTKIPLDHAALRAALEKPRDPVRITLPPRAGSYIASSEDIAVQSSLLADQRDTALAAARLLGMAYSVRQDRLAAAELVRRSTRLLRDTIERLEAYGEGRLV